jgi:hypothetical protein
VVGIVASATKVLEKVAPHGGAPSNGGRKIGRPKKRKKSFDKFFEKYSWGKDETPPEGEEQRKALSVIQFDFV